MINLLMQNIAYMHFSTNRIFQSFYVSVFRHIHHNLVKSKQDFLIETDLSQNKVLVKKGYENTNGFATYGSFDLIHLNSTTISYHLFYKA